MTFLSRFGGRRALTVAAAGLFLALACSTPDVHFVDDVVDHCNDKKLDANESDTDCGGQDCHGCALGQRCNGATDCSDGQCIVGLCQEPGCDNSALDGDETGVDCGGSCKPCRDGQPCSSALDCQSKVCGEDLTCASPSCMDGFRNGDELGVDCGGSFCDDGCPIGTPCRVATDCESGLCDPDSLLCALNCVFPRADCNGSPDDPCETNLLTAPESCGACGVLCDLPHAKSSCTGGACQIDECTKPWIRCNTDAADGCEVNGSADVMNCGGCGMVCPDLHGKASCVSSQCVIECTGDFGDCDRDARTGCEASLNDVNNCGSCGHVCSDAQGVPNCPQGECGYTDCDPGLGDCDGDQTCETSLSDDPKNCGRCGNVCNAPNGNADCVDGQCVITSCDPGWDNCDTDAGDGGYATGCEANTVSDPKHCGGCALRCDQVANGTGTCQNGACALDCSPGFEDCDGRANNGCEIDTTSDPAHCGGCKSQCDIPHATAACVNSGCVVGGCDEGFQDCNGASGCETDVSSSVQHCGSCLGTCLSTGATKVSCTGGACDPPVCDANHLSCDGKNENGCETDISTVTNCGACGNACGGATPNCVVSGSTYKCQAKITIANGSPYPTAQATGSTLTFNATPHLGTNRLILLALMADATTQGVAAARPGSVTWGSLNMTAGPSQVGTADQSSPDLFVYYLPLGDSAADGAQVTVTIKGSTGPANIMMAQELQLNGVRQSNPITGSAGSFLGMGAAEAPDPSVITLSVPVAVSGSLIYSFTSSYWSDTAGCTPNTPATNCPSWSVSPATNLSLTETMATSSLNSVRAFGMVVSAASPSLPAVGTYQPSWSIPWSGRMTHLAVALAPAQSP